MFKRLILMLACLAMVPAAGAQNFIEPIEQKDMRDPQVMSTLLNIVTAAPQLTPSQDGTKKWDLTICGVRGGNGSAKPLGQYMVEPRFEFKSDYKNVPPELMCKFAFDLHSFIVAKGRDWPKMQRNTDLKYVPYDQQRDYADMWWRRNYEPFKNMGWMFKDGFLMDAMADGTNVYNWYYRQVAKSTDYMVWEDAALQELVKKH